VRQFNLANKGGTAEVRFRPDLDESVFYLEHQMRLSYQPNKSRGKEAPLLISAELAEMGGLVVQ